MSSSVTIRISRNQNIANDRSIAILKLNKLTHYEGQPVMVKYWSESGKVDTLLALGIKDGIGEDCYKIISLSGLDLVKDVVSTLPDISLLIHNELYLYRDPEGIWNYVYASDNKRVVEPIVNLKPTTFVSIKDKFRWFWDGNGNLKREDDFKSSEEMASIIDELFLVIGPPKLEITSQVGYIFYDDQVIDIPLNVKLTDTLGNDLTDRASFFINKEAVKKEDNKIIIKNASNKETSYVIDANIKAKTGKEYTFSSIVLIDFGYDFYYGKVTDDWVLSEDGLKNLENTVLNSKRTINYKSIELNLEKVVFSYPEKYGKLLHIYDEHGLDHIEDYDIKILKLSNDINYYVYIKSSIVTISDFDQKFLFVEEDNDVNLQGVFDSNSYDEIVLAWENKNTYNGLVQLNEYGKIPNELLSTKLNFTSDFSFINVVDFLDYYPNKINLTIGNKWYNAQDKLIFEATGLNQGITYPPTENTIYFNNKNRSLYLWKNEEMILVSETIVSKPITNIIEILD